MRASLSCQDRLHDRARPAPHRFARRHSRGGGDGDILGQRRRLRNDLPGLFQSRARSAARRGENFAVWIANYVLIDGKMRTLFSMLFGASMLIVIDAAVAAGRSPARAHYARMIVLLLFGLLHFYVIWHGDILVLYALTGMVAFLFRTSRDEDDAAVGRRPDCSAPSIMFGGASYEMRRLDSAAHSPGATAQDIAPMEQYGRASRSSPTPITPRKRGSRCGRVGQRTAHMVTERGSEPFESALGLGLPDAGADAVRDGGVSLGVPDRRVGDRALSPDRARDAGHRRAGHACARAVGRRVRISTSR